MKIQVAVNDWNDCIGHLIEYGLKFTVSPAFHNNGEISDTLCIDIKCTKKQFEAAMHRDLTINR